jgi:hypothetical protein
MSFNDALDLVFFRANPMGFVLVDFRLTYRTIGKFHLGDAFKLPPASLAVCFPKSLALANRGAGCDRVDIRDAPDNLEVHSPTPLIHNQILAADLT